jgi:hypothetical protein
MQCTSCGTPLQSDMDACPTCGSSVPPTVLDSTSFDPPVEIIPYVEFASSVTAAQSAPGSQLQATLLPNLTTSPTPQTLGATPLLFHASPSQSIHPVSASQPSTNQRRSSPVMIVLLTILILIVIAETGILTYYITAAQPAQLRAQATSVAQTLLAHPHSSSTSTITPQNTYSQIVSGKPILNDSLTAQGSGHWDELTGNLGGVCRFKDGAYHASEPIVGYYRPCYAQGTNFSDFAFQVRMMIVTGDAGGILFRADSVNVKQYYFRVNVDGFFRVYAYAGPAARNARLLQEGYASPFNTGLDQSNLLSVIARGSNIDLYVNKQLIISLSNSAYSSGKIGVFASTNTHPTDVAFTNAEVWTL